MVSEKNRQNWSDVLDCWGPVKDGFFHVHPIVGFVGSLGDERGSIVGVSEVGISVDNRDSARELLREGIEALTPIMR